MRHESAVAEPPQMLMLLILPMGSNQNNLALDLLALMSERLTLLGFSKIVVCGIWSSFIASECMSTYSELGGGGVFLFFPYFFDTW